MHLRSGRTLGPEVVPEDSASNVDLEAILGSSLTARERSSLNSTSSVLGPLFEYESSKDETMSMEDNMANQGEIQVPLLKTQGLSPQRSQPPIGFMKKYLISLEGSTHELNCLIMQKT